MSNTVNAAVKKEIKQTIKEYENKFLNSGGGFDYRQHQDMINSIRLHADSGADFSNSEISELLLETLSSYKRYIDYISQDKLTLEDEQKEEMLCDITCVLLTNFSYLDEYAPRDMDFSKHENLIKKTLTFCDTTICDLLDSDIIRSDDLYLVLDRLSDLIKATTLFPFPQLSQKLQQGQELLDRINEKFDYKTDLSDELTYIIRKHNRIQEHQYFTYFTPDRENNFVIDGESYDSCEDIRDHFKKSDKACTCEISGTFTDISGGEVTEKQTTVIINDKHNIINIAFKFYSQHKSPETLLSSKTQSLRFPKSTFKKILFDMVIQGKQEEYQAAVEATAKKREFQIFPSFSPGY